ncbi:hypothetical protein CCP3SC1_590001 [Gammaproteobacteria bacterium]
MAKKSPSSPKKPKTSNWKNTNAARYNAVVSELVHFSSKTVNSNAAPCGVRLTADQLVDLPYVAVSTMPPGIIPYDYYTGADVAGVVKQVIDGLSNESLADKYTNPPNEDELHTIRQASRQLDKSYVGGTDQVSVRLRQIIVQDRDGNDIALTPLQSAGFSHVLKNRLEEELAAQPQEHHY